MEKSLRDKLHDKFHWGIIGVLLTIAFGIVGVYTYFHERKPNIQTEIVGESNVLDLHKPLENLTIYFNNEDIQKKNLNLRIINIQISNSGEMDILQSHFDQKMKWGIKISNGQIINDARIVNTNSDYLKTMLSPKVIGDDIVEFEKVIFEKGKYFSIEILVLHDKETLPEITFIGKIAGIDKVLIEKTWETKMRPSFLRSFFSGGYLINILRPIVAIILAILVIIVIAISEDKLSNYINKFKQKRRKKEIEKLVGDESKDDKFQAIIELYINKGLKGLKDLDNYLKDDKNLLLERKKFVLNQEYETKLKDLLADYANDKSIDIFPSGRRDFYAFRYHPIPQLDELNKKKIIEFTDKDEVVIDSEFRKSLLRIINFFEEKAKKGLSERGINSSIS
ncbi:MAG: hypothetical protein WA126_03035 [Thermodesulfovibrionales bacterium]